MGLLDDLVYRIKKSPRAKTKVVHHDRLKPYHSRAPLDTSWVLQDADTWAPVEVVNTSSDTEVQVSTLHLQMKNREPSSLFFLLSPDWTGTQSPVGEQVHRPLLNDVPLQRPQRGRRLPDMFGDWVSH